MMLFLKKIRILLLSAIVMILLPFLVVTFIKGDNGMAICFILFYVVNLLLLWRWFCLVLYSPVTPYLQGIHGFWKFVAVHQKSSFFRNLGSKLASDSTPERKIKYFIDYGTYTFGVPFLFQVVQRWTAFFIPKIERRKKKYE